MNRFTTTSRKQESTKDISFVIFASNVIPRAKNAGPRSLFRINNNSNVIDIQYTAIKTSYPESEIWLVVGHMAQQVISYKDAVKYDIKILENQMFEGCGQLEESRLVMNMVTNRKVFIIGDVLFNAQSIRQINLNQSSIFYNSGNVFDENDVGCIFDNSILQNTTHGVPNKWSKIVYLRDSELDLFRKIANNRQKSRLMLNEGINYVVNCGGVIKGICQTDGYMIKPDYLK